MLTEEQIFFLEGNIMARQLLYWNCREDQVRADQFFSFLREAYRRRLPVTLSVEVGGITQQMHFVFDRSGPEWELYNYLGPWVISMSMKDCAIADHMGQIWPDLVEWYEQGSEKRGPQIAPETP